MAEHTNISWCDSTWNSWWGCMKVSPACDHCYAESTDKRAGGAHWGAGVLRRQVSANARNEPYRWQRKADEFFAAHGRDRRVFTLSMGDLFDNEVPDDWRLKHMDTMDKCDRLKWQICTKRIGNLAKMIPTLWNADAPLDLGPGKVAYKPGWPQHIGVLITVINQEEADRDIPKLLAAKARFGIPWVGISYEPAQGPINFWKIEADQTIWPLAGTISVINGKEVDDLPALDWIIVGGESGANWRPMDLAWARAVRDQCAAAGTAFFFKQVAAFRPTDDMIPEDLRIRQFPAALC